MKVRECDGMIMACTVTFRTSFLMECALKGSVRCWLPDAQVLCACSCKIRRHDAFPFRFRGTFLSFKGSERSVYGTRALCPSFYDSNGAAAPSRCGGLHAQLHTAHPGGHSPFRVGQ